MYKGDPSTLKHEGRTDPDTVIAAVFYLQNEPEVKLQIPVFLNYKSLSLGQD